MIGLTSPLTQILLQYKKCFDNLHPFEATIVELTILSRKKQGKKDFKELIHDLKAYRALTSQTAKAYITRIKTCTTKLETKTVLAQAQIALAHLYNYPINNLDLTAEVLGLISSVPPPELPSQYHNESTPHYKALENFLSFHKDLRYLPEINLTIPTLVLVGAPNVGKSSIIRCISSGTPEVANYPFTTRGLSIGHIINKSLGWKIQVMDSPGLLDRPETERNEMEKLTYASLAHLPTAVVFVIDPSGYAGDKSTLIAQLNIRKHLRERFPRRPWIDVRSKSDIELSDEVKQILLSSLPTLPLPVSSHTGEGVDKLKDEVGRVAQDLKIYLQKISNSSNDSDNNNDSNNNSDNRNDNFSDKNKINSLDQQLEQEIKY